MINNLKLQNVLYKDKHNNIKVKKNPFLTFQKFKDNLIYFKCLCGNTLVLTTKELKTISPKKRCAYCENKSYKLKKENYKDEFKQDTLNHTLGILLVKL